MSAFSCFSTNTKTLPILITVESRQYDVSLADRSTSTGVRKGDRGEQACFPATGIVCNRLNYFPRLASVVPFGALRQYFGGRFCVVQSRTLPDSLEIEGNTVPIAKGYKVKKHTSG